MLMLNQLAGFGGGGPFDPHWADVVLRMTLDGADGSTAFADLSSRAHSISAPGSGVEIDTAQSVFGGASGLFPESNRAGSLLVASSADFNFGSGAGTVEWWLRPVTSTGNSRVLFRHTPETGFSFDIRINYPAGTITVLLGDDGGNSWLSSFVSSACAFDAWTHYALVKSGSTVTLYKNGVADGSASATISGVAVAAGLHIGGINGDVTYGCQSWMDDIRITKGVARDAAFWPPTSSLPIR